MHADIDHLRLRIQRRPDHWRVAVLNRLNGACLFSAECTNLHAGSVVLFDFVTSELGKQVTQHELTWLTEDDTAGDVS